MPPPGRPGIGVDPDPLRPRSAGAGHASASACSRSAHSASGSSSPTESRSRPGRDAVALPAMASLELGVRAAEARRVPRQAHGPLHPPRRLAVGDVERDQEREPRVAHGLDRRMCRRALGEHPRASPPGARGAPRGSRARAGRARRCRPGRRSRRGVGSEWSRSRRLGVACDGDAGEHVVVAREHLRRRVEDDVAAVVERTEAKRRGDGRVADDRSGVRDGRLEIGHRQDRVRGRLDEDQVGAGGRRARLVELDDAARPTAPGGRAACDGRSTRPRRARSCRRGAASSARPS